MMENRYKIKELLTRYGIIEKGDYILRSGQEANTYIKKELIFCNPPLFNEILSNLECLIIFIVKTDTFDIITGPVTGGIILASPIATFFNKILVSPNRSGDEFSFKQDYQDIIAGRKVLIVDDVMTTGGSVRRVARKIKEAGGDVRGIIVIWDRGEIEEIDGIPVYPLVREKID